MAIFQYKAIGQDGALVRGTIEGEDAGSIHSNLSSKGLYIINIRKANRIIINLGKKFRARSIRRSDIIEFANNLSVMLRAGVPLLSALDDIINTSEGVYLIKVLSDIKQQTEMGTRFSDAIGSHSDVFPDIFVRVVQIGEETGGLDKSMADIAGHLQKMEDLSQAIKRALMYPAFAIITTMGAMLFWLMYVLPKVMAVFKDMQIKLPLITRVLMHASDFAKAYWYMLFILPLAVFIAIQSLKRYERARYYVDMLKLKLPILKLVIHNKLLALFSEQLRIMIVAGLTITRSFEIIAAVMSNEVFRRAIAGTSEDIITGSRISDALRKHWVFPRLVVRMVDIGETSGNLDEQFGFLSGHYIKKLDDISQKMGKMIEPIVITFIGIMFAVILAGLLLPVYDLISGVGKF